MHQLSVIVASTRPGRVGLPVSRWFFERAKAHGKFDVRLVDLKEVALPLYDEPKHPRMRQYEHAHTKAWSAIVEASDAFVFVMPEYNHSVAPALLNAIDYLFVEWGYKAAGLVSYGGASGGMRAAQALKPTLAGLKVVPLPEAVAIAFVQKEIDAHGAFVGGDAHDKAAVVLLDELLRWTDALKPLRG